MMTGTERVRLSRWVNKAEELADQLLALLKNPPAQLPRDPVLDPELIDYVARYSAGTDVVEIEENQVPNIKFLEAGNGHQTKNRDRAIRATVALIPDISAIDKNTVQVAGIGACHFAAFSHPKGAMVSSTRMSDLSFGSEEWHSKEWMVLFRDAGDGRCFVYVDQIRRLYDLRTIGHHGVKWEDVREAAARMTIIRSSDALKVAPI